MLSIPMSENPGEDKGKHFNRQSARELRDLFLTITQKTNKNLKCNEGHHAYKPKNGKRASLIVNHCIDDFSVGVYHV
jgi:hypothetical protein